MLLLKRYFKIFCVLSLGHWTQAAYLRYYGSSLEDYKETDLRNPLPLLKWIDFSKPTFFYAFGFKGKPSNDDVQAVTSAFIKKNTTNYILVNWEMENKNDNLEPVLAHALTAVPNSILIGKELGIALLLLSCSLDMSTVQLAGHSLGAHVAGYAGSLTRERGIIVARITGLDPSGTNYEGYIHTRGLDSSSAAFVDVWHTDPANYGTLEALGDVDIWFNCNDIVQPGCAKDGYLYKFTDKRDSCSHRRAPFFFAEAVSSPKSFVAVTALSCKSWAKDHSSTSVCNDKDVIYLNENIVPGARGLYYLDTNAQQPYARGQDGIKSN